MTTIDKTAFSMQRVWSTYLENQQQASAPFYEGKSTTEMENLGDSSRPGSADAHSNVSHTPSTRYMLADPKNSPADVPNYNFSSTSLSNEGGPMSLSVNYLPSKFSSNFVMGTQRNKKGGKSSYFPKRGGGVEAFRSGEARIPGENDEDYDGVQNPWFGSKEGGHTAPKLRWNKFKWTLFIANVVFSIYSLVALIFCLCTWFNVWARADVVRVGNHPELVVSTIAGCLGIVTSVVGWSGILLNNRSFLAMYTFMLWIVFAFLVTPGYITYKRRTFNLEGKINAQWSRGLAAVGRLRIQDRLGCCGYFSPFVEATISQTCYARSILPGCKKRFLEFERLVLKRWYIAAFSIVPLHIFVIVSGLLCSNHVTYRFGKGMMPKAYRLSMNSMAVIMDNYASQLAEQYGTEVASEILARSRSNLQLDKTVQYASSSSKDRPHGKYDSLSNRDHF